jgi:hypothetical protein
MVPNDTQDGPAYRIARGDGGRRMRSIRVGLAEVLSCERVFVDLPRWELWHGIYEANV